MASKKARDKSDLELEELLGLLPTDTEETEERERKFIEAMKALIDGSTAKG